MTLAINQTIPILRIFDEAKARSFYVDFLGFQVDWEHRFQEGAPLYMQVSRSGCMIHLSEHYGDGTPGTTVFLRVTGLHDYNRELLAKNHAFARPGVGPTGRGSELMQVHDPFGNSLRFEE